MKPNPHVSEALAHLRFGVTACAIALCLAAMAQMLVFGFVHFTTIRWAEPRPASQEQSLSIVAAAELPRREPAVRNDVASLTGQAPQIKAPAPVEVPEPPVIRELSTADPVLRRTNELVITTGWCATISLAVFTMMGVAVAGGAAVPGVNKVVSSATWAVLLLLVCMPWKQAVAAIPFQGVFSPYHLLTESSAGIEVGTHSFGALLANFLLLPLLALATTLLVLARFRAGIAAGVIVTSVNELDEALEKEMAQIRKRGVVTGGVRGIGTLNQALGAGASLVPDPEEVAEAQELPSPPAAPSAAALRTRQPFRTSAAADADGFKRPI